jgi:hypothetical protein
MASPLEAAKARKPQPEDPPTTWAQYQLGLFQEQKNLARRIFDSYIAGKYDPRVLSSCLESKDQESVDQLLSTGFLERSLERLSESRSPSLQSFLRLVQARRTTRNLFLFRLAGHLPKDSVPDDLPGSFHRGEGSIFMNFARIAPNEWYVILLHELAHAFDDRLNDAIEIYAEQDPIITMVKDKKGFAQLTLSEAQFLNRWITAGLDRGLLAEYRAWLVTFELYREGVQEGLWKPIPWLEAILAQRKPGQDLALFTFHFLDPHFTNPMQWPFTEAPVKEAFTRVREELRASPAAPTLGNLRAFASDAARASVTSGEGRSD